MDVPSLAGRRQFSLRGLVEALFRQLPTAAACFVFVSAAVTAAVVMAPPQFESGLKLLVKRERADAVVSATSEVNSSMAADVSEQEMNSEVELILGQDILERVATTARVEPVASTGTPSPVDVARAARDLRADLGVNVIRRSWIIDVTYASSDPRTAKAVLDALAQAYLDKHLALHRSSGAHTFFTERAAESETELGAAQSALREYLETNNVVSAADERQFALARLAEFDGLRRQSDAALAEAEQRLIALEAQFALTPAQRTSLVRTGDASGLVQEVQSSIRALESRRTELLQKFTPEYRLVTDIDEQLAEARAALAEARTERVREQTIEDNPTMRWLENEIVRVRAEAAALAGRSRALGSSTRTYRAEAVTLDEQDSRQKALVRDVTSAEEKLVLYRRKQEEARISDALDRERIANVAVAQAPTTPVEPIPSQMPRWIAIGLLGAVVVSVGAALAKDAWDSSVRIRTPDELQLALDGLPVLGWVPGNPR